MEVFGPTGRVTRRTMALTAAIAIAALTLAGCSGGVDEGATGDSTRPATVVDAMSPVTEVDAPTEAFTPPSDKHIMVLYCGSAGQGCVNEAEETKVVAESLGWKVDMVDGKLDPTVWNQAVKQAADQGIDGIISISGDPNLMAEAMDAVNSKDIPFVLTNQVQTADDVAGVDSYIAPDPVSGGNDIADWVMADSDGKANILLLDLPGYYSAMTRTATIADALAADCSDCVVERADITVSTMGTSLAPLVTSRLQQNPDIDYILSPDDCCVSFVYQGIQQAGRTSDTNVISVGGFADQLATLTTGPLEADQATPNLYMSWLSVDQLARLMGGGEAEQTWTIPQRIWTSANIGEADPEVLTSGWNLDLDYQALFKGLWGVN